MIDITLPDGSIREYNSGVTAHEVALSISEGLARNILSAEVNGEPKLMCMTRMSDYDSSEPLVIKPMKTFPVIKDLVTDVSWNYEVNKKN